MDDRLHAANSRLKESNAGIVICKRGQKLSLRGNLPSKDGKGYKQQYLSLGIYCNAAGIQVAEKKAQKLASQLALKEFSWNEWSDCGASRRHRANNIGTLGYWVSKFETDYFNRKARDSKSQTTWDGDYKSIYKRGDSDSSFGEEILLEIVLSTEPDTRNRIRAVNACNALARFANLDCKFNQYKGNYNPLIGDRILPTDKEIAQYYYSIKNPHWQRAFGIMAAYGISNHELFYVDLDSLKTAPGHLVSTYRKAHYGFRRIWCLYPEWYEQWELAKPVSLPKVSGQTNKDLGHRVSTQFRRYELCKPGDLRHCWAIRAMAFMPDSMAARMMAHDTATHNRTYKRWMNENQEDKFYQLLMQRSDRPKPPG
ncbi:MAG: site-specific integrase [Cyanobacteria bacterium J06623_7]